MWILHRRHFHGLTGGLDAWLADGLGSCPLGYYAPANYCVSSPSNHREAIQKIGSGGLRGHGPRSDQVEQVADVVDLNLREQPLRARRRQVAEGRVVEAGGVHNAMAG